MCPLLYHWASEMHQMRREAHGEMRDCLVSHALRAPGSVAPPPPPVLLRLCIWIPDPFHLVLVCGPGMPLPRPCAQPLSVRRSPVVLMFVDGGGRPGSRSSLAAVPTGGYRGPGPLYQSMEFGDHPLGLQSRPVPPRPPSSTPLQGFRAYASGAGLMGPLLRWRRGEGGQGRPTPPWLLYQ